MRRNLPRSLPLFFILLLAGLLRFYNLSGQSLWSDEGNSVALARRSFVEIVQRTTFDIHPPLYYWLLKIWITVFGDSELGLRSLSVVLGIGLVYVTAVLGRRLFSPRVGLIAAFIAACSPLQIYYSQETRMYMLLTFLGTLTVLLSLLILDSNDGPALRPSFLGISYIVTVAAGLYTHYAYPVILVVVNGAVLVRFAMTQFKGLRWFQWNDKEAENVMASRLRGKDTKPGGRMSFPHVPRLGGDKLSGNPPHLRSNLLAWLMLQLIPFLFYLPWLPTAWRQVTTWPSEQQVASLPIVLETVSNALLFGLSWPYSLGQLSTIVLGLSLLLAVASLFVSRSSYLTLSSTSHFSGESRILGDLDKPRGDLRGTTPRTPRPAALSGHYLKFRIEPHIPAALLLWLWLLLPVLVTVVVYSPAFLKFVLIAGPAVALLLAHSIEQFIAISGRRWLGDIVGGAVLSALVAASLLSLYHYHTDTAFARDDYRGIVQFIKAVGGPDDAVILHAEGQQDVFNYYNQRHVLAPSAPVYPLPRRRPLDEAATLTELKNIRDTADKVYGLYWATQQADPDGLIENWLDDNLFKATDQWYGNVRLVSYASPQVANDLTLTSANYQLGPSIRLTGYALSSNLVVPGDILQVALRWQTNELITENYTTFLQLVDEANHLVGQRDAQPVGPTTTWPVDEAVADAHGIFVEPGTPPGKHRLTVGLYNGETGQRLSVNDGDFIDLGEVEIVRLEVPLPIGAFRIQTPLRESRLGLTLLGYDFYKLGHRSTPDTALYPGDPVQLVAYWVLDRPSSQLLDRLDIRIVNASGKDKRGSISAQLAGVNYPVAEWQPGEIVRAQYGFFLSEVEPGAYRLSLGLAGQAEIVLKPFQVE